MKVEMKLSGADSIIATLNQLPAEVVSKNGGIVRLSLAKAARLIRDEARKNWRSAVAAPGASGITESTGFTEKLIVNKRARMKRGEKGERQVVTVRYGKLHPSGNRFRRRTIYANDVAFIMEVGTAKQPAQPWMRPAFEAKAQQAIDLSISDLNKRLAKVIAKLAAQNKAKG